MKSNTSFIETPINTNGYGKKFYKHGKFREIGFMNPDKSEFTRNIFLNPDDAIDRLYSINKDKHCYMSVYGYHESVKSSKEIVDNNIVFDRLVYDFDLNTKDDRILLSLNGYTSVDLKDMSEDDIKSDASEIRQQEDDDISKLSDDPAIMKYYHQKYEHDYLKDAIDESKKVYNWFKNNLDVDGILFFSGGKGSHLHILLNNPVEVKNVKEVTTKIGDTLKKILELKTIDSSVYTDKVRLIRLPTSRHQETKLFANPFKVTDKYVDIIDNATVKTDITDIVIPDNDTSNLEEFIKNIDDSISIAKKNKAVSKEIKEDASYTFNNDIPIYDDADLKNNFLKVYKKGQMNSIGHRIIHLFYRSHVPEDDVRQFFMSLQVDHNLDEVYRWIDRTYNLDLKSNDHIGGLNYFLDGINQYASDDDKDSLLSYFKTYFIKKDKEEYKSLNPFRIGRDSYESEVTAKLVNGLITEITIKDLIKKDSGLNFIFEYGKSAKFQVILNDNVYDHRINYTFNETGFKFKNKTDYKEIESLLIDEYSVPKIPKSLKNSLISYLSDLYDYIIETNKPDEKELIISSVNKSPTDTSNLIRLAELIEDELSIKRTDDKKSSHYYLNTNPNDFNSPTMDKLTTSSLGYILLRDYNIRLPDKNVETVLKSIHGQHRINTKSWEFKDGNYLEIDNNYQVIKHDPIITSKKMGLKLQDKFYFYDYKPEIKFFNILEDETLTERTLKQILIPKNASSHITNGMVIYDNPDDYKLYIDFLQRIGASFNPNNIHKKITMYYGKGDNGKSLLSYILYLVFKDYYYGFTPKQLKNDSFTESMASGKHILIMDELAKDSLNGLWDIIKRYSSGLDNTTKRTMYSDDTDEISTYGLLYVLTNIIPDMPTDDKAILRRVDILTLPNVFTSNPTADNEYPIIDNLTDKLGIDIKGLEWLINAGIKAYKDRHKFIASQTDIETLSIVKKTDDIFNYLYKHTEIAIGHKTFNKDLFDGFNEYCKEHNIITNLSDNELKKEIGKKIRQIYNPNDLESDRESNKRWYNIRIKSKKEIEQEETKKWSVNEYVDSPAVWDLSGIDRNVFNLIKEGHAVTIKDLKKEYPKVDIESIVKRLEDKNYIMDYEIA